MRSVSVLCVCLAVVVPAADLAGHALQSEPSGAVHDLRVLEFLSGCWRGSFGQSGAIEEFYTGADGGLMLGTTRFFRGDRVVQYEFARIQVEDGHVVLMPYPNGRPSEHGFALTSFHDDTAVFEAPEHDYPKRIIYARDADDGRTASIDAGADDPSPRVWTMTRVPCVRSR